MRRLLFTLFVCFALVARLMAYDKTSITITVNGQQRSMIVFTPSQRQNNMPLMIITHGMGQSPEYQSEDGDKMYELIDTEKFICAYLRADGSTWDISGDKDVNFVSQTIDEMYTRYQIDKNRVYWSGFSMGSMLIYNGIKKIADKIAAFAPTSGVKFDLNPSAELKQKGIKVNLIHHHSNQDTVFPIDQYKPYDYVKEIAVSNGSGNPTAVSYQSQEGNYKGTKTTWKNSDGNEVVCFMYDGGGHWPSYYNRKEIWNFCKRWSKGSSNSSSTNTGNTQNGSYVPFTKTLTLTQTDSNTTLCNMSTSNGVTTFTVKNSGEVEVVYKMLNVDVNGYSKVIVTFAEALPTTLLGAFGSDQPEIAQGSTSYTYEIPSGTTTLSEIALISLWKSAGTTIKVKSVELYGEKFVENTPEEDITTDTLPEKYNKTFRLTDLTQLEFCTWSKATADGVITANPSCDFNINKKSDMPYGYSTVNYLNYADLSGAEVLIATVSGDSEPRFLFNRTVNEGTVNGEITNTKNTKYLTKMVNADGSKIYYVDIAQLVKDQGFAHLHAIKGVNFAEINITSLKYGISDYDEADYTNMPIHQEGKDLVNTKGEKVVLHGVMDTPNAYFNGWKWDIDWSNTYNTDAQVTSCLNYFKKILSMITDKSKGGYCDLFRLHLDPAWTNDPNKSATNGGGENDISRFNKDRLVTYLDKLYWPIIEDAMAKGLYIIVRPPGVCPEDIKVGDDYYNYLMTVWDVISKDERFKKYAGQVSIELANEPINVIDYAGNKNSDNSLRDFFQPITNMIRKNGFKGIIWAPGRSWQWHYEGYTSYPITGDNIGYAVHFYPGWHGTNGNYSNQDIINQFKSDVPVVENRPVVITEVDWSPEDEGNGHYDEQGNWVVPNYGTWGTGTTTKFGNAFRAVHDYFKNVSFTIEGTGLVYDIDTYLSSGKLQPAFSNKNYKESCAICFDWYKEWYHNNSFVSAPTTTDEPTSTDTNAYYSDLLAEDFFNWTTADKSAVKKEKANCAYELGKSTGMPYGDGNVHYLNYADLSHVDKIYVTATEGEPRLLFNRIENEGTVNVEVPRDKDEYEKVTTNSDGSKTYVVDVAKIVSKYGFAHLHAIKGANWQNTTVTSIKYTEKFTYEGFDPTIFAQGKKEVNNETRVISYFAGQWGFGGWHSSEGYDVSIYNKVTIEFEEAPSDGVSFRLFDADNYWGSPICEIDCDGKKSVSYDISNVSKLYYVGVWARGSENLSKSPIKIKSVKLSSNKVDDVNCDGKVDMADVTALQQIIQGTANKTPNADVNGDGNVNITDVTTLINKLNSK